MRDVQSSLTAVTPDPVAVTPIAPVVAFAAASYAAPATWRQIASWVEYSDPAARQLVSVYQPSQVIAE